MERPKKYKKVTKILWTGFLLMLVYYGVWGYAVYLQHDTVQVFHRGTAGGKFSITETLTADAFYSLLEAEKVKGVIQEDAKNLVVLTQAGEYYNLQYDAAYMPRLELDGLVMHETVKREPNTSAIALYVCAIILGTILIILVVYINTKKQEALNQKHLREMLVKGETPATPSIMGENTDKHSITFDDVQGIDALKPDLYRLVDGLKNPEKYKAMGARLTKGVVFYGPPGTGKTLTAKALAGEAGVPFFSVSGSDFIEKFVGVGAQRVRELYAEARVKKPCIVFIDEIDAIGGGRGDTNNSEKDQTINALLTELDGFKAMDGVLTICATNRLDMLDSALTRAGRFDLKLAVELPDKDGRLQILKLHSGNKKLGHQVKLLDIANKTCGFSGAELENLLNEAALIATTLNKKEIHQEDIENAFFKIIMEGNKKPREANDTMAKLIAYHEAGHTLAIKLLTQDGVPTVTIVQSTSGAGGVTFRTPAKEGLHSKAELRAKIKVSYAGRAAEEVLLGNDDDITTGASQDIKQATNVLKSYIGLYGMGTQGMLDIRQLSDNYDIIPEASKMSLQLYAETLELLKKERVALDALAEALLDKEVLNEEEIDKIIREKKC